MKFILQFAALAFLLGCQSPINNRVNEEGRPSEKSKQSHSFSKKGIDVEISWLNGPIGSIEVESQILVILRKNGEPYSLPNDNALFFYSTMPSMGHPLDDPGEFVEIESGLYLNRAIVFNMRGEWKNELWILNKEEDVEDELSWVESF